MDDWEKRLQRIATLDSSLLGSMREGVAHEQISKLTLDVLVREAADERFRMARQHYRDAETLHTASPPAYRSAISRYYYAFYHAARATAFIARSGDDYEAHSSLWKGIPDELPNVADWRIKLKDARLLRNQADYDPYPKDPTFWDTEAATLRDTTRDFMLLATSYLKANGGFP